MKKWFIGGAIVAVAILIIIEIVSIIKLKPSSSPLESPQPIKPKMLVMYTFDDTNPGFYGVSTDKKFFSLFVKLEKVYQDSTTGDIRADVALNLINGVGPTISQTIILSSPLFTDHFGLDKQNSKSLFPDSKNVKITILSTNQIIPTLSKYQNSLIHFAFIQSPIAKAIIDRSTIKTRANFIQYQLACNQAFFSYLSSSTKRPTCIPYSSQIYVYAPDF